MNEEQFVSYVMDFYGTGGLYDIGAREFEVRNAIRIRQDSARYQRFSFDMDSVDREFVRDIIIEQRQR